MEENAPAIEAVLETLDDDDSADANSAVTNIYTVQQLVDAAARGGTYRLQVDLYINIESGQDIYRGGAITIPTDTSVAAAGTISSAIEVKDNTELTLLMYDMTDSTSHKIYFGGFAEKTQQALFYVHNHGVLNLIHEYSGITNEGEGLYCAVRTDTTDSDGRYFGAIQVKDNAQVTLGTRIKGFTCSSASHQLGNGVTVGWGSTFTMAKGAIIEECNSVVDGRNGHSAVGLTNAVFNFNEGSIRNCDNSYDAGGAFYLCHGVGSNDVTTLNMGENAEIIGCKAKNGSAISADGGDDNSKIVVNFSGSIIGCTAHNEENPDRSSTVSLYGSTMNMNGGKIQGNTCDGWGSAIRVGMNALLNATGGTITGNTSKSNKGALSVEGEGSQAVLDGVTVSGNITTAVMRPYGPVQCADGGAITMKSGRIVADDGATYGGCVGVREGGTFNLQGGTLRSADSGRYYGGCVYVVGTFNMMGGTMESGGANKGGAIFQENGTLTLSGGTIANCKAVNTTLEEGQGGLLYLEGGTAYVTGGVQLGSEPGALETEKFVAGTAGGYFYLEKGSLTLTGVTLDGGHAQHGGAIYQMGGILTLDNCTIEDNEASEVDDDNQSNSEEVESENPSNLGGEGIGGGLCVVGSLEVTQLVLKGSTTFKNNTADKGAMGKKIYGQDIYLDYVSTLEKTNYSATLEVSLEGWTGKTRVAISAQSLDHLSERTFAENAAESFTGNRVSLDSGVTDYALSLSGYEKQNVVFRPVDAKWGSITDTATLKTAFEQGGYWSVDKSFILDTSVVSSLTAPASKSLVIDFKDNWITVPYSALTDSFITVPEGAYLNLACSALSSKPLGGFTSDLTTGTRSLLSLEGGTTILQCAFERFYSNAYAGKGMIAQVNGKALLILDKVYIAYCQTRCANASDFKPSCLIGVDGDALSKAYAGDISSCATVVFRSGSICSNCMYDEASPVHVFGGLFLMEGGSICHNYTDNAYSTQMALGAYLCGSDSQSSAQFVMDGGSITGNYLLSNRGTINTVVVSKGLFTMTGGLIDAGRSIADTDYHQNVLFISSDSKGTMEGGTISGNTIGRCVTVEGEFLLEGGTLCKGNAVLGGGVYTPNTNGGNPDFTMTGGIIKDCKGGRGGAIAAVYENVTVTLISGVIENCSAMQGGAFSATNSASVELRENVTIRDCSASAYGGVAFVSSGAKADFGCTIVRAENSTVEDIWVDASTATPANLIFQRTCSKGLSISLDVAQLKKDPTRYATVKLNMAGGEAFVASLSLPAGVSLTLVEGEYRLYRWTLTGETLTDAKADPSDLFTETSESGGGEANSSGSVHSQMVTYNVNAVYNRSFASDLLDRINDERGAVSGKVPRLTFDSQLEQVALQRAAEISLRNTGGTSLRPDGTSCYTTLNQYECVYMQELTVVGASTVQDALAVLLDINSPSYQTLTESKYAYAGVAYATVGQQSYWVVVLGDARGSAVEGGIGYGAQSVPCQVASTLFMDGTMSVDSWSQTVTEGGAVALPTISLEMETRESSASVPGSTTLSWEVKDSSVAALSTDGASVEGKAVGKTTLTAYAFKGVTCEKYVSTAVSVTHDLTAHLAVAATCTAGGNSAYWSCGACGKFFSDAAATAEVAKDSWVIAALGHDSKASFTWGVGLATATAHLSCSRCDLAEDIAAAVERTAADGVLTAVAKATFEGKEYTDTKTSIVYHVGYHENGGVNPGANPTWFIKESADISLVAATWEGYTFNGWYSNADLSGQPVTCIASGTTSNVELWAKWSYDLKGDVNGTGRVNIVDAQVTYDLGCGRYGTNYERFPLPQNWTVAMLRAAADVNNDGFVDATDAFAIQRMVHGL